MTGQAIGKLHPADIHRARRAIEQVLERTVRVERNFGAACEVVAGAERNQAELGPPVLRHHAVEHLAQRAISAQRDD